MCVRVGVGASQPGDSQDHPDKRPTQDAEEHPRRRPSNVRRKGTSGIDPLPVPEDPQGFQKAVFEIALHGRTPSRFYPTIPNHYRRLAR